MKWNVFLSAGHQELLEDTKVLGAALEDDEAIGEHLKDAEGSPQDERKDSLEWLFLLYRQAQGDETERAKEECWLNKII